MFGRQKARHFKSMLLLERGTAVYTTLEEVWGVMLGSSHVKKREASL